MVDYLSQFPPVANQWLYFDYLDNSAENQGIAPVQQDNTRRDIVGNKLGQYDFAIVMTRNVSNSTDDTNVQNMDFIESWGAWLEEQNYNQILPDFGENCEVERIQPLSNMGNLSQVYDNGTGKYMLLCRVNYIEKGV